MMIEKKEKKRRSALKEYVQAFLSAILLALVLRTFVVQAFTIPSGSMLQTVQIGDYLLVNKFAYGIKVPFKDTFLWQREGPRLGDIIVFKYPRDPSVDYIKRVVGLPGDVVEMRNKQFYRNGQAVHEDYIQHLYPHLIGRLDNVGPLTIPEDSYFVMGDNRDNSEDSRAWGFVPRAAIHGKAWRIYWSWDKETHTPRLRRLGMLVK